MVISFSVWVSAPRKASRWGQAACVTTSRAETQLKPALFTSMVATCSAWYSSSVMDHRPGTTITGDTLPSSAVTGLSSTGSSASLRRAPSAPGPKTTAS